MSTERKNVQVILTLAVVATVATACSDPTGNAAEAVTYVDLSAGSGQNCALTDARETICWGYWEGEFISGDAADEKDPTSPLYWLTPRRIEQDPGFATLAVAGPVCGLTPDGRAYCWGRDEHGQLGDGDPGEERLTPEPVATDLRFRSIATGGSHACALDTDGKAYCWGNNFRRMLGGGDDFNEEYVSLPHPVAGGHTFAVIAAQGGQSCGLTPEAELYCWGSDASGLRNSGHHDRGEPVLIQTPVPFDTVVLGSEQTCGLADGEAYCRGWNGHGALGTGDTVSRSEFTPVSGGHEFASLSSGGGHFCGITVQAETYCWGAGRSGALGHGSYEDRLVPTPVAGDLSFRKVSAGSLRTCGLTHDGDIYCWGDGRGGALGIGGRTDSPVPVKILDPLD